MTTAAIVKDLRTDTPGCDNKIHLNNAGAGLMTSNVLHIMKAHLDLEAQIGGYEAAAHQRDEIQNAYQMVGQLLTCPPENIAFTNNATDAYARALSCIDFKRGDIILTTNNDYVSNQIAFLSFRKRFGIEIVRIPDAEAGGVDVDKAWELMKSLRPKLVAVTHMPTSSGLIQPVEEIGKYCRQLDMLYLVDACQTVGQLNINVQKIGCDFLSATCRKFLRGPRGAGFLYVSDKVLQGKYEPLFIDMRGAQWEEKDKYIPHKNATRFEDWEFSYALILGSGAAVAYALSLDMNWIEERIRFLADYTREELRKLNHIQLLDKGTDLGGIVTINTPTMPADQLKALLDKNDINTSLSHRSSAVIDFDEKGVAWVLRISPHYYNTVDEIDRCIATLLQPDL